MYARSRERGRPTQSGRDDYNARHYGPVAGQFTSADTVDAGGLNRYAYVGGNPTTATDPSGHCLEDLCIGEGILTYLAIVAIAATVAVEIHNLSDYLQTHPISVSGVFGTGGTWGASAPATISGTTATSGASASEMAAALKERVPLHGYRFPVSPPTPIPGNAPASVPGGAGGILTSNPPSTFPTSPTSPASGTPVSGTPASVGAGSGAGGWAPTSTDPGGTWRLITQTLGGAAGYLYFARANSNDDRLRGGDAKISDRKQINDVANELGMTSEQRRNFGKYVEMNKRYDGRGGDDNYTWQELLQLGHDFLEESGGS